MPKFVLDKASMALKSQGKSIKNSNILVLGLAYKKNIDDTRESPSLEIIKMLIDLGAKVKYSDPYLPKTPKTRKYNFEMESVDISKKVINEYDLLLLCTDHDDFDYELIKNKAKLILDTRGRFKPSNNVFRA